MDIPDADIGDISVDVVIGRVDDITVENVRGSHAQNAVWLGDDNGQDNTDNGEHGKLVVSDVDTTGDVLASCQVFANLARGAREINLSDITLRSGLGQRAVNIGVDAGSSLDLLRVDRIKVDGLATRRAVSLRTVAGAIVKRVEISSPYIRGVGGNQLLLEAPQVNIGSVFITNPDLIADDTASTNWIDIGESSTLESLSISGGTVKGGRCLVLLRVPSAAVTLTGGLTVAGVNRLGNFYKGSCILTLGDVTVSNVINRLIFANSDMVDLTILGGTGVRLPSTPTLIERPGSHPVRANGSNLIVDIGILTPKDGDQVTALVAKGVIPTGAQVLAQGGRWKDLFGGNVWP